MRSRAEANRFVQLITSSTIYRPDGSTEATSDLAVWTLAHRGYSGGGRLDVWVYRTETAALREGAVLAMDSGLDEDTHGQALFADGDYRRVLERYEETSPNGHVLSVQPAFLQDDAESGG